MTDESRNVSAPALSRMPRPIVWELGRLNITETYVTVGERRIVEILGRERPTLKEHNISSGDMFLRSRRRQPSLLPTVLPGGPEDSTVRSTAHLRHEEVPPAVHDQLRRSGPKARRRCAGADQLRVCHIYTTLGCGCIPGSSRATDCPCQVPLRDSRGCSWSFRLLGGSAGAALPHFEARPCSTLCCALARLPAFPRMADVELRNAHRVAGSGSATRSGRERASARGHS